MSDTFWINGELVCAELARIAPDDLGFTVGLAVFETLLWEQQHLGFLERHLLRMRAGAEELAIAWPPPWDPREALRAYVAALGPAPRAVRATLTRGRPGGRPTLAIGSRPVDRPPAEGVVLAPSERLLIPDSVRDPHAARRAPSATPRAKSTNRIDYALAREEAQAAGAWDALLPTTEGDFAEASVANVFAVVDGVLCTPPLERGCLSGVMRALVLESAPPGMAREVRLERELFARAEEVFLTNTTGRVIGVREIAGLGRFEVGGPGASAARERIAELELRDRETPV